MTQVTDDVAELNAGKITVQQLGERWAARTWVQAPAVPRNAETIAAIETADAMGPPGSWTDVGDIFAKGILSLADFIELNDIVYKIKKKEESKAKMRRAVFGKPTVGHRHPTEIELSAKTDFVALQKTWQDEITKLLGGWDEVKNQQIIDLKNQIQVAVDNGSVERVAGVMTTVTGSELILKHMTTMMENSVVLAKQEAAAQGIQLPTIDTVDVVRSLQKQSAAMGQIMARSISNSAATQALTRYGVENLSGADVADAVGEHLDALSPSYADDMLGGALNQAQNQGRAAVFDQAPPSSVYSSELLDQSTCINCEEIDGHDYASLADAQEDYPQGGFAECLGGPRCRGTLVAVYEEATTGQFDDGQ